MSGTDCRSRHKDCGSRLTRILVTAITDPIHRLTIHRPSPKNTRPSREAGEVTGSVAHLPAGRPVRRLYLRGS
jgi:hypothetical protein